MPVRLTTASRSATGIVALSDEDIRAALWTRLLSEAAHGAIGALTLQSLGAIGSEAPSVSLATVSPNACCFFWFELSRLVAC